LNSLPDDDHIYTLDELSTDNLTFFTQELTAVILRDVDLGDHRLAVYRIPVPRFGEGGNGYLDVAV